MAGFSDKQQLQFYSERGSPNSKNNSLLIPDDSYSILLYENQPNEVIVYSSIIVQKTKLGYRVYGNNQEVAYFVANIVNNNGFYETINVFDKSIKIPKNFFEQTVRVPYGTEFSTVQDVVDFLLGHGEWLKDQGFSFNEFNKNLETVSNWETSAKEFMFWTTQN